MKWFEVPLMNMPIIIASYIILQNLHILIIKGIRDEWIIEPKINKIEELAREKYKRVVN